MSGNSEVVTIRTLVEDKEMHQWKKFRELYTYKLFWCLGKPTGKSSVTKVSQRERGPKGPF